jgi:hypothetical protein
MISLNLFFIDTSVSSTPATTLLRPGCLSGADVVPVRLLGVLVDVRHPLVRLARLVPESPVGDGQVRAAAVVAAARRYCGYRFGPGRLTLQTRRWRKQIWALVFSVRSGHVLSSVSLP